MGGRPRSSPSGSWRDHVRVPLRPSPCRDAGASGFTWALSIVGLVIVIRIILIPLFVKQIKASRGLQMIQPEMQKIQKKYKGKTDPASRQAMTQETMALYKESGTNPFASCLPILLQSPVFFALYRVLNNMDEIASRRAQGDRADHPAGRGAVRAATIFGASLSSTCARRRSVRGRSPDCFPSQRE